jgi:hypothetical protein
MGRKIRTLVSALILIGVVGWIVLSYMPPTLVSLPQFSYLPNGAARAFPALLLGSFLVFIGLQAWLVQSTAASIQQYRNDAQRQSTGRFPLDVRKEAVLTALPIGFTVALAGAAYLWWRAVVPVY